VKIENLDTQNDLRILSLVDEDVPDEVVAPREVMAPHNPGLPTMPDNPDRDCGSYRERLTTLPAIIGNRIRNLFETSPRENNVAKFTRLLLAGAWVIPNVHITINTAPSMQYAYEIKMQAYFVSGLAFHTEGNPSQWVAPVEEFTTVHVLTEEEILQCDHIESLACSILDLFRQQYRDACLPVARGEDTPE